MSNYKLNTKNTKKRNELIEILVNNNNTLSKLGKQTIIPKGPSIKQIIIAIKKQTI